MASKRQLLCPIASACRLILLNFRPDKTKIKITNNAIELVEPTPTQGLYRWWESDSRNDICALYPMIVRFIELYLCPAKKPDSTKKFDTKKRSSPREDIFGRGVDNDDILCSFVAPMTDICEPIEIHVGESTQVHLKQMARYLCRGLALLQKTYNYDNAVFALQYYIGLIESAIEGTYDKSKLPAHIRDDKRSFLDQEKVRELWNDDKIEKICDLFVKSFDAKEKEQTVLVEAYHRAILTILAKNDEMFRTIAESTMM